MLHKTTAIIGSNKNLAALDTTNGANDVDIERKFSAAPTVNNPKGNVALENISSVSKKREGTGIRNKLITTPATQPRINGLLIIDLLTRLNILPRLSPC